MSKPTRPRNARQEKAYAAREATRRAEQRRTRLTRAAVAAGAVIAVGGLVTLGALTGKQPAEPMAAPAPASVAAAAASAGTALPPWPNASDPLAAIRAAGITPAEGEGSAEHYHAHLDVIVNGKAVPVAAEIGVDEKAQKISPLHTHDGNGVIHVEAPTVGTPYYLGQLFREWNVALTADRLGGLRAGTAGTLAAYVDGKRVTGDPAKIRLAEHQEIALVFGSSAQQSNPPRSYDFANL